MKNENQKHRPSSLRRLFIITSLVLMQMLQTNFTKAQTALDSTNAELRALFSGLAKPAPPKLFNWDMCAHLMDSSLFQQNNINDTLNQDTWIQMYSEMYNSAFDTTLFITPDSLFWPAYDKYGPDTINILAMHYDYYRFKPGALDSNIYFDFDTINNILTDMAIRPGFPYDNFKVFAASPVNCTRKFSNMVFRVGLDNILSDNFTPLNATGTTLGYGMEINFDDNNGWQTIDLTADNYFSVNYDSTGKHVIQTRVLQHGQPIALSISSMTTKKTRAGILDLPVAAINNFGMNALVYNPCNSTPVNEVKTIIYLEGIDPMDFQNGGFRNAQEIYEDQIIEPGLSDLRNFGYRFIVVSWANSRIKIQQNAQNLIDLINNLKCEQADMQNNEQFVIMGESMGGLVAKYAMMRMEQDPTALNGCSPEKEHNTRLLITLDSPHDGAHIPMSIQKMANFIRNTGGALAGGLLGLASGSVANAIIGAPFGLIGSKLYFKSQDLLLDGDAAKQMLMNHVSTQSLFGPWTYNMHNKRKDFLDELQAMGNYPRHTKLVATSNGNMSGFGQTRYWDGLPRTAGDALVHYRREFNVTVLGRTFAFAGVNMELNTDPNGIGTLGRLSFGTWWIKVKLKWFGLRFYTGFNSLCNKDWDGDMRPIGTSSGGIQDMNWALETNMLDNLPIYNGQGNYADPLINTTVRTDGFHWGFIPTTSALDFGHALNVPFDAINPATIMGFEPFDVIQGIPNNHWSLRIPQVLFRNNFQPNAYIRNQHHLFSRNDTLKDNNIAPNFIVEYNSSNCTNGISNRPIQTINREIGDDQIYIENRNLPWEGNYTVQDLIFVNIRNPYYTYPNIPTNNNTISSLYSKANPFIISNPLGFAWFNNSTGNNLFYVGPFSGPYAQAIPTGTSCCQNYYRYSGPSIPSKILNNFQPVLYPNPNNGTFTMQFQSETGGNFKLSISNIMGQYIYTNNFKIASGIKNTFVPVQLNYTLPNGTYIIKSTFNNQTFTNKFNKQ
jgi:hypothetical protein